jgi:predicted ATPase
MLIGINGSGKSNLLKALSLLKVGIEGNSEGNALQNFILSRYGGFDSIYCKSLGDHEYKNTIGLEFTLNGAMLSEYGPISFRDDIVYKIVLVRKGDAANYFISEKIEAKNGFVYLDFYNGQGKVSEKVGSAKPSFVQYDDYSPQELSLSKLSDFDKDRYLPLVTIKKALKDIFIYNYFDTTYKSKLRQSMAATSSAQQLLPDGANLPQVLNQIKIHDKVSYKKIQERLADVNPYFSGFDFNFLGSGVFELMLDEKELDSSIHITHVSDGTLRYLCLLAILYNVRAGSVICIDEPEVGLHPDMIFNISRAIKEASAQATLVVTTHSVEMLNYFNLDQILVFDKREDNTTAVKAYTNEDFEGWYDQYLPGKMWKAGDLGGKRWQ